MEQDPKEILFAVKACIKDVTRRFDELDLTIDEIVTVGITNQRETTIAWDAITGEPLYNAIGGSKIPFKIKKKGKTIYVLVKCTRVPLVSKRGDNEIQFHGDNREIMKCRIVCDNS